MKKLLFCATLVAAMMSMQSCCPEDNPIQGGGNLPGGNGDGTDTVTVINGHECVDLGLSVKWATCNVGATLPEDYGDYFAWGEIAPKDFYTEENSVAMANPTLRNVAGDSLHDAARANWGATWRMPTRDEMRELVYNCTFERATRNGILGGLFTSKLNGKSIFLPFAGFRDETLSSPDECGCYWSSERDASNPDDLTFSFVLYFDLDAEVSWHTCQYGSSVRPVSK